MNAPTRHRTRLGDQADVKVGFAFPSRQFVLDGEQPRLLRGMNVKRGRLDWSGDNERRWGGALNGLDAYALSAGDLVIAMDGALVGRSYATVSNDDLPAYLVQRVARVRARDRRAQSFIRHMVGSRRFVGHVDRVKTHTAVPHISGQNIEDFSLPEFSMETQAKLGQMFDHFLELETGLESIIAARRDFKRGIIQQLLTGKNRFPEFRNLPWSSSRLGDHVTVVTRKNKAGITLVLTASGEHGLVDQRQYFNRNVAGADISKYFHLKRGEFAYNRSAMNGYPYGATKRLDSCEEGVLSVLYLCFAIADPTLDSEFLKQVFDSGVLNRQLRPIVRVGARAHGLLNVTDEDFLSIGIPFPSIEEQRRIAAFLSGLDREIDLLKGLQKQTELQKDGLLSRLLSGEIQVPVT